MLNDMYNSPQAEAMQVRCSCKRQIVGGWSGFTENKGQPMLSTMIIPVALPGMVFMYEKHTREACYGPRKLEVADDPV